MRSVIHFPHFGVFLLPDRNNALFALLNFDDKIGVFLKDMLILKEADYRKQSFGAMNNLLIE